MHVGEKTDEDQLDDRRVRFILEIPDMKNCKASQKAVGRYETGAWLV